MVGDKKDRPESELAAVGFQHVPIATSKYLEENLYAFSLRREVYRFPLKARVIRSRSVSSILGSRLYQGTYVLAKYLWAMLKGWKHLKSLSSLNNSKRGRIALVLGNGPSLGYITPQVLSEFQEIQGDIFSVNYWTSTHLKSVIPNYLVISDGLTLAHSDTKLSKDQSSDIREKNELLRTYLLENKSINIFCPLSRREELSENFAANNVLAFVDHEMRMLTRSIDPRLPRGYVSFTLLKALSLAIFLGYEKIFLLGMDNTFPRDTYCDENNRACRLERHAGSEDYLFDQSSLYPSMAVVMQDISDLFYDISRCFAGYRIINLDPYSLTDTFEKVKSLNAIYNVLCRR